MGAEPSRVFSGFPDPALQNEVQTLLADPVFRDVAPPVDAAEKRTEVICGASIQAATKRTGAPLT